MIETLATATDKMQAGAHLHMEHGADGQRWWLEKPFAELDTAIGAGLRNTLPLIPLGDALFSDLLDSQSWRLGAECGHCAGTGSTTEAACCMQPRHGECCGNPVPQQVQCGECGGGGVVG